MDKVDEIAGSKRGCTPRRDREPGLQFQSSLLKRSLVKMHETPTMLPPRNDLRRHIDTQVQDEVMKGVMDGVTEPVPAQNKPSRPKQIDPRINPNGMSSYDPMLMMRRGSTMRVIDAAEMVEILPKRTATESCAHSRSTHPRGNTARSTASDASEMECDR